MAELSWITVGCPRGDARSQQGVTDHVHAQQGAALLPVEVEGLGAGLGAHHAHTQLHRAALRPQGQALGGGERRTWRRASLGVCTLRRGQEQWLRMTDSLGSSRCNQTRLKACL